MGKTVLVVEDDIDIQEYYEFILTDIGLEIVRAYNGVEALAVVDSQKKIDLIILDLIMPVMGGAEFLQKLRLERQMEIPVIISTVDKASALNLEKTITVQGFFFKLGKQEELVTMVNANLN